jgi:hypothetical protein
MTAGQTPETIMSGSTADISNICEFAWFDWVMFSDNVPTYPDDKLILGRYLGPATDVGSAMTMKILKRNGQVVYRSTVRHLNNDEISDDVHIKSRHDFDLAITESHGPAATASDFPDDDLTPEYEDYNYGDVKIGSADDDPEPEDTETLAPHVGCRRVVFVPNWRHSVSCRATCRDIFQSCRRHKKMSCRLECLNDTTFDDMSGISRHVGNFFIVV